MRRYNWIADELRWVIAILVCLIVPVFGMALGFVVAAIPTLGVLGTDNDGAFSWFFLYGPVGALTGFGVGLAIGSKAVEWARDSEAHH